MEDNKNRLVVFHLFNDFSGSPMVLKGVLQGLADQGKEITLVSSKGGVLDSVESTRLKRISYNYKFSPKAIVTLFRYSTKQLHTSFIALRYLFKKDTVFYINTILPIGPAIIGKITGKKVVYHYHENAFVKSGFYRMLTRCMEKLADEIICVSKYQASFLRRKEGVTVIPNSLDPKFVDKLHPDPEAAFERKNILLLGSLKGYKGVKEFIDLAGKLPEFNFTLVINDNHPAIMDWLEKEKVKLPSNLELFPRTQDVTQFYNQASIVLNLTNPKLAIETFGLTALEAMSCALPVIVPPVGGIAEMVEDGINGYKINVSEIDRIAQTIREILSDKEKYLSMARNSLAISKNYRQEEALKSILQIL